MKITIKSVKQCKLPRSCVAIEINKRHFKRDSIHWINWHFNWGSSNTSRNGYRSLANVQVHKSRLPTLLSRPTKKHPWQCTLSGIYRSNNNHPWALNHQRVLWLDIWTKWCMKAQWTSSKGILLNCMEFYVQADTEKIHSSSRIIWIQLRNDNSKLIILKNFFPKSRIQMARKCAASKQCTTLHLLKTCLGILLLKLKITLTTWMSSNDLIWRLPWDYIPQFAVTCYSF